MTAETAVATDDTEATTTEIPEQSLLDLIKGEEPEKPNENESTNQDREIVSSDSSEQDGDESVRDGDPEGGSAEGGVKDSTETEGDEDDLSQEHKSEWPAEALARIGKLSAKAKERLARVEAAEAAKAQIERERDELRQKLETRLPVQVTPSKADPLADVTDEAALAQKAEHYRSMRREAAMFPEGAVIGKDADGNVRTVAPEDEDQLAEVTSRISARTVAQAKLEADEALQEWIPARQQYLAQDKIQTEHIKMLMPNLLQEGTPENQEYVQVLKTFPELTRFPAHKRAIMWQILGRQVEAHILEGNKTDPKPKVKPEVAPFLKPAPAKAPAVSGTRGAEKAPDLAKTKQRAEAGDEDAKVDFISSLLNQKDRSAALV